MTKFSTALIGSALWVFSMPTAISAAASDLATKIDNFKATWDHPPMRIPHRMSIDAPLLGNGDMKVAIGGNAETQKFILCKNDMWRLQHGKGKSNPLPFGTFEICIPELKRASYKATQDIYTATTVGEYSVGDSSLTMECYTAATENVFVINLNAKGKSFKATAEMKVGQGRQSDSSAGKDANISWAKRAFTQDVDIASGVAAAWKLLGERDHLAKQGVSNTLFTVAPGQTVTIVLAMDSVFDDKDYEERVKDHVRSINRKTVDKLRKAHLDWWDKYYHMSYVNINDPIIEKQYYLSLYGMGSCSRNIKFPPAIFGWTTSDGPAWHGDYHLNYNYQAPFYGLARANRLEQADPHDTPFLEFIERGTWHCKEMFGYDGVMYPVGIGPRGIETTYNAERWKRRGGTSRVEHNALFHGQRTNAAYGLVNMAPRWHTTYDLDYGKRIYPFVRKVATFWENYVTWDEKNKRFIIENDSIHEGSGKDMNSILSLALVRNAFKLALDMSKELNVDGGRRDKWNHILKNLSNYTFQERGGKQVFRYTEKGTQWWKDNTLGIQHIYPAGQIHLDSDPKLLEVSMNTLNEMKRWQDGNGSNSFFPAAVRIGYDPAVILEELRKYSQQTSPNGFQLGNAHGIENLSTVPNTINEMLCMGHEGVIRLFVGWPKDKDASFTNIRCWGAFLVSANLKNGVVGNVKIESEKGRDCTMINPWPGKQVTVNRNGKAIETLTGQRFKFKTQKGDTLTVSPQ